VATAARQRSGIPPLWLDSLRLRFDAPPRPHRPRGDDRLPQRALELTVRTHGIARSLAAVAERRARERQVVAGLVDQTPRDAEVDELTVRVDSRAPPDLELGFGEGRSTFVLRYELFTLVRMRHRRVLGYARVSSELQGQGSSLRDQQAVIALYAKAQGLPTPTFYVESESAIHERNERRERIRALQSEVRAGDLVVCDKIDRWSRDPEFTYRSIRKILSAGASFYAVGDQCDPSTPEGDTMLNFRVLFAKEEHKRIKARMVGTRRILRDQGYYVEGVPPFGYRRSLPKGHKGPEKNVLAIEEDKAALLRRAFRMCIAGHSLTEISAALGLGRDQLANSLRSRVYLGEIQDTKHQWIKSKHPPVIDVTTFTRAQAALDGRRLGGPGPRQTPSETSTWILRDVARCDACGAKMSAVYAGPRMARRYYYKCAHKCGAAYVVVRDVEANAGPIVVARLEGLKEELVREPRRAPPTPVPDFAGSRARLQRRREKYLDAFADELMTKDELRARMAKLDADELRIDGEEQASLRPNPLADVSARRAVLREVGAIARAWGKARPEARREIVRHLAVTARVSANKAPRFVWRSPEELVEAI
jgi:DNA invertase Pin-like site-specific DNA recombinase